MRLSHPVCPGALRRLTLIGLGLPVVLSMSGGAASAAKPAETLIVREALGITLPRRTVNSVLASTPLDAWFAKGKADAPREGESVRLADGTEARWQRVVTDSNGWFPEMPLTERFVAVTIEKNTPARMILEGMGHDIVYVNGTPRSGNPYQQKDDREPWEPHFDYSRIPLDLNAGQNLLLFRYSRGRLKIKLSQVTIPIAFNANDVTLPDALVGSPLDTWGSIVIINSTAAALKKCSLVATPVGGRPDTVGVPQVPATGIRKVPFRVRLLPHSNIGDIALRLTLLGGGAPRSEVLDTVTLSLRVVDDEQPRRETIVSSIDGSVQYYAVTPPRPGPPAGSPALFLSLHGAGVEALNQAAAYSAKNWGYIIAPTNRRPYGFSWEDWGRMDALEVLDIVKKKYNIDEGRVYLTGHSMGGHGTWFLGATYPDKFAAIAPSAGWITFQTYRFAGAPEETSAVQRMLRRAAAPSDLFTLADNYRHFGVYILHGDKDDNVPPEQSHMMIERLRPRHKDFEYYEQPGAGHWWDNSPEPGTDCVDWRPMFDFFSRHIRSGPDRIRSIEFTTANPGLSASDSWLSIDAQERQLAPSTVSLFLNPGLNQVQGTTVNVSRLSIERNVLKSHAAATVELDSQKIVVSNTGPRDISLWFEKERGKWGQASTPSASTKGAHRYGTFKEAFRNNMVLVYGTAGTAQENMWAFARARFDAEKLWYQGNASVDVLPDTEFVPSAEPDRNVVLYGNSDTHRLWKTLLPNSPVSVDRKHVVLGNRNLSRPDISCIFVRPRPGSNTASVGVVAGTGIEGMMLSHIVRYLEPGLGLPDLTVFNADVLTQGDRGIILTGFFGLDWSMTSGEFAAGK